MQCSKPKIIVKNMNIQYSLDHETILANQERNVHLVLKLTAPKRESNTREPIAFNVVLDRSGSMQGQPLHQAKLACERVIQNLRNDDLFSLVIFDSEAELIIPHRKIGEQNRPQLIQQVRSIQTRGSTNLTGGWMLGRDEIRHTPKGIPRRILLLSDGCLNQGITEPAQVREIMSKGYTNEGIRTSCLGFGDHYNEELLADIATATHGSFYDVKTEDNLPGIFAKELEGLQQISIQNLRIAVKAGKGTRDWDTIDDLPKVTRDDGIKEVSVGDILSEEERVITFKINTKSLPLHLNGKKDPKLLTLGFTFDALGNDTTISKEQKQVIRIRITENPDEVVINKSILGPLSIQQAGLIIRQAYDLRNQGQVKEAQELLQKQIDELRSYNNAVTGEAIDSLLHVLRRLEAWTLRDQKMAMYSSKSYRRHRSMESWSSEDMPSPSFKK